MELLIDLIIFIECYIIPSVIFFGITFLFISSLSNNNKIQTKKFFTHDNFSRNNKSVNEFIELSPSRIATNMKFVGYVRVKPKIQ